MYDSDHAARKMVRCAMYVCATMYWWLPASAPGLVLGAEVFVTSSEPTKLVSPAASCTCIVHW